MEYSNLFVCLMGMGTVFFGLIVLIILVSVMSSIVRKTDKVMNRGREPQPAAPQIAAAGSASDITPEMVAAVSAAIAEELGTDVNAFRIVSFRKV